MKGTGQTAVGCQIVWFLFHLALVYSFLEFRHALVGWLDSGNAFASLANTHVIS